MSLFFIIAVAAMLAAGALYWRWQRAIKLEIAEGAEVEWEFYNKNEPEMLAGFSKEKFHGVYASVHAPRFPAYALATFITIIASLPVTFGLVAFPRWVAEKLGLIPEPIEIVRRVQLGDAKPLEAWECGAQCQLEVVEAYGGFYYFFAILFVWLLIVAFYMRRYHSRRPGYLRDELIRARE